MSSYRRATATKRRAASAAVQTATKNGVLYLRVSSLKQTHTAADVSVDGNSIATQREECDRKAVDLGVAVQEVFVEPGRSAQTIEKRPEFRRLLAYLAEHPEVDYVIVYSRSRAFRNIEDAILTRRHLRGLGVKIISTKEDFGDSLESEFMETITDSMNDLQNRRNGEDIKMKMAHKARNGGTIGRAPIGYLNVRKELDGRQINSVAIDEQRGSAHTNNFRAVRHRRIHPERPCGSSRRPRAARQTSRAMESRTASDDQLHPPRARRPVLRGSHRLPGRAVRRPPSKAHHSDAL